ncbi:deoxyguanosinetriphosphate triphosphohydrolase [Sediminivirga luteola]|uniref:Deoxyguanosinetriphosphate triphosphohydrolase-like protein n=1 Tax=Sediminivirga luteola TaxID=1774748 RepID=A0A8J2XKC5_9MICO|nr:deoxyguanosinetriphosphate triphosphohydrolase [Sediminivirga luteola]MCI2266240.1 deoxyguanosinetriphosphate triphosphohydrolase [Sediminivirga luteola]GGA08535.1 deoxyguanosinetriphosphate triphosphohydrolase-like protein [Sediminivirga luteola]
MDILTGQVAGYSAEDRERWVTERAKNPRRSAFQRDRARVLHSSGLRRLGAKTQVVSPGSDDFVRNRLTHSLEVAQVGRELARYLGCDPDIVDAACLSHDLGHPPFGHNGETALARIAADIGGFEGNAQTLRLLTRLEPKVAWPSGRPAGLNLTRATLDAVIKYPWPLEEAPPVTGESSRLQKFGVYADDLEVFRWCRNGRADGQRCLEAQLMDLADDISYSVHDMEDAVVGGHLDLSSLGRDEVRAGLVDITRRWYLPEVSAEDITGALDRLTACSYWQHDYDGSRRAQASLKHMTSQLIGRFAAAAEAATREEYGYEPLARYEGRLMVPEATAVEIAVLKGLSTLTVMVAEDRLRLQEIQQQVLFDLADYFQAKPEALEPMFAADHREAETDAERLRVVIDQIASLTDHSAWSVYHSIHAGAHDRF